MNHFNIGDIVYVLNYKYKDGEEGQNHSFVIIDEEQAVDIEYFGFLLSSQISKSTYPYNKLLNKNSTNNLKKDSIVKCDDLIEFGSEQIQFKIGQVSEDELSCFIDTYSKYLDTIKD